MEKIWTLYSTFGSRDEAISIARALVEEQLVACANIYDGVTSIYRWEGEIQQEPEAVMIAKTVQAKVSLAIEAIKQRHSYALPCIVAYPVENGFDPYLQWVAGETISSL